MPMFGSKINPISLRDEAIRDRRNPGRILVPQFKDYINEKRNLLNNPSAPHFELRLRDLNSKIDDSLTKILKSKEDLESTLPELGESSPLRKILDEDLKDYNNVLREYENFSSQPPQKEKEAAQTLAGAEAMSPPAEVSSARIPSFEASLPSQSATENMRVKPDRSVQFREPSNTPEAAPRVNPISAEGVAQFVRDQIPQARAEANKRLAESVQRSTSGLTNNDIQRDARAVEDAARREGNTSAALQGVQQGRERQEALNTLSKPKYDPDAETKKLRKFSEDDLAGIDPAVSAQEQPAPLTRENLQSFESTQPPVNNRYGEESVRSIPTMHTGTLNNYANALGAQEHEKRMEMTNPYKATAAKRNPEEIKAMRAQLRAENQARQNNALNDISPELFEFHPQDTPAGVDVEADSRNQLIKMMMGLLKHKDQDLPIEQMFAAEDPNKIRGDEELLDFLKARHNLNDPGKLQEFLGSINGNNQHIGNTLRSLLDEESIAGRTKPYLDEANAPITAESLEQFSRPSIERMNQDFRKQALERFKEESDERRQNFLGNLHSQYGGYNWFSSQRRAAEKQFNDAELRQKRDLEDRLKREEHLTAQNERHLGANLMMDNKRRNLASAEQVGKTSSLSNITRAAAAQNLQNFNEMQEAKHLGGINQMREIGAENTAREQNKLNSRIIQKATKEATNRGQPMATLAALTAAPYAPNPYANQPVHTPVPLQQQVGHNQFSNVRPPAGSVPNQGQDIAQRGVELVKNVFGA